MRRMRKKQRRDEDCGLLMSPATKSYSLGAREEFAASFIRKLKQQTDGDGYESEVALLQSFSRLFRLVQFIKCWQIFLDLNSERPHRRSGKEKESHCLVFASSA